MRPEIEPSRGAGQTLRGKFRDLGTGPLSKLFVSKLLECAQRKRRLQGAPVTDRSHRRFAFHSAARFLRNRARSPLRVRRRHRPTTWLRPLRPPRVDIDDNRRNVGSGPQAVVNVTINLDAPCTNIFPPPIYPSSRDLFWASMGASLGCVLRTPPASLC